MRGNKLVASLLNTLKALRGNKRLFQSIHKKAADDIQ